MSQQNYTIPKGFEAALSNEEYDIFNCGITGIGLSAYLQFMEDAIPIYKPDVAFLCIYLC